KDEEHGDAGHANLYRVEGRVLAALGQTAGRFLPDGDERTRDRGGELALGLGDGPLRRKWSLRFRIGHRQLGHLLQAGDDLALHGEAATHAFDGEAHRLILLDVVAACTQVKGHTLARLQGSREAGRDGQQARNLSLLQERLTLSRINPTYAKASIFGQDRKSGV